MEQRIVIVALFVIALAFGLGSIPFGVLIAKRRGVDIRTQGSGNIGATNATRVMGLRWGALVLVFDAGKGAAAIAIAMRASDSDWVIAFSGFAAVVGHCFSPWLGGRGGKGVATALGVFAVISLPMVFAGVLIYGMTLFAWRVPAIASLSGAAAIAFMCVRRGDPPLAVLGCAVLALLVYTHRTNLAKLRER